MALDFFLIARCALLFVILIFVCVGTGVEWFKYDEGGLVIKNYLYGSKVGDAKIVKYKDNNNTCSASTDRINAAYAFSIITCIVAGFALVTVALQFFLANFAKILKFVSLGLTIAGFVTSLIAWAIGAGLFHGEFCGGKSMDHNKFKLSAGFALFVVAWILFIFGTALAAFSTFFGGGSAAVEANA